MEIVFSINYRAEWGQRLCISGSSVELGNWDEALALELTATSDDRWEGRVTVDGRRKDIAYYYLVRDAEGRLVHKEWKRMHHLVLDHSYKRVLMDDRWIDRPKNAPFYSSAFYDVFFRHEGRMDRAPKSKKEGVKVVMQLYAPCVHPDDKIYMTGNALALGEWSVQDARVMHHLGQGEWSVTLEKDELPPTLEYKFFIRGRDDFSDIRWEEGANRIYRFESAEAYGAVYLAGLCFREGDYMPRYAGTVIPLFGLRSENDWGIGDFGALHQMVDWAAATRQHMLQLLPINDTTYTRTIRDSYPYNIVSVMALHPIYIHIDALPRLKDEALWNELIRRAQELSVREQTDYPAVLALKEEYLHALYRQEGAAVMRKKAFRQFVSSSADWLDSYVAYCYLRDKYDGLPLHLWQEYTWDRAQIERLAAAPELKSEMNYYRFVQFLLHEQLQAVTLYAEHKGILLKGDIPIGVSSHSAEVWLEPALFDTEHTAGAPPDQFAEEGQNWGFPIYRWDVMSRNGFAWWRKRFEGMAAYFKAFRIDHILGFFRIWEVPTKQVSGLLGHFNPALPLTEKEIKEYGFPFDRQFCTLPLIHTDDLQRVFGRYAGEVLVGYLRPFGVNYFTLDLKCFYQTDILALDPDSVPGGNDTIAGLMRVATEVCFVIDPEKPGSFHPRISFERTLRYSHLNIEEKRVWQRMSEDYFYKRNDALWKETALSHLIPLLSSTDMLVCAEDLGMIPPAVPEVMEQLQLLSLVLERTPKNLGQDFADMERQPYCSVCTTSTHDMPPMRLWWQQNEALRQRYYTQVLGEEGSAPEVCTPDLARRILMRHLKAASMLAIFPLSDWMALSVDLQRMVPPESEQINHPEDSHHYWCYRMPMTVEALTADCKELNEAISALIRASGR